VLNIGVTSGFIAELSAAIFAIQKAFTENWQNHWLETESQLVIIGKETVSTAIFNCLLLTVYGFMTPPGFYSFGLHHTKKKKKKCPTNIATSFVEMRYTKHHHGKWTSTISYNIERNCNHKSGHQ
jgi:ribonuclease HI